jgi:hypothetical protein
MTTFDRESRPPTNAIDSMMPDNATGYFFSFIDHQIGSGLLAAHRAQRSVLTGVPTKFKIALCNSLREQETRSSAFSVFVTACFTSILTDLFSIVTVPRIAQVQRQHRPCADPFLIGSNLSASHLRLFSSGVP